MCSNARVDRPLCLISESTARKRVAEYSPHIVCRLWYMAPFRRSTGYPERYSSSFSPSASAASRTCSLSSRKERKDDDGNTQPGNCPSRLRYTLADQGGSIGSIQDEQDCISLRQDGLLGIWLDGFFAAVGVARWLRLPERSICTSEADLDGAP